MCFIRLLHELINWPEQFACTLPLIDRQSVTVQITAKQTNFVELISYQSLWQLAVDDSLTTAVSFQFVQSRLVWFFPRISVQFSLLSYYLPVFSNVVQHHTWVNHKWNTLNHKLQLLAYLLSHCFDWLLLNLPNIKTIQLTVNSMYVQQYKKGRFIGALEVGHINWWPLNWFLTVFSMPGTMLSRMSVQLKPGQLISIQRSPATQVPHCYLNAPHHVRTWHTTTSPLTHFPIYSLWQLFIFTYFCLEGN